MNLCRDYQDENLPDIIQLLVRNGIDLNCDDKLGSKAFLYLCGNYKHGNLIDIVRIFLQHGVDVNCKNKDGSNTLHLLCQFYGKRNLIDIIQLLIKHEIDVNSKDWTGNNAFLYLCAYYKEENLIEILQLLFKHGIEVNYRNHFGETPVHLLCTLYKGSNRHEILHLIEKNKPMEIKANRNCCLMWNYFMGDKKQHWNQIDFQFIYSMAIISLCITLWILVFVFEISLCVLRVTGNTTYIFSESNMPTVDWDIQIQRSTNFMNGTIYSILVLQTLFSFPAQHLKLCATTVTTMLQW